MKSGIFCTLLLAVGSAASLFAQDPPQNEEEADQAYQQRIRKEYLKGVYIPQDLGDAFVTLNGLIDEESKKKFRSVSEEEAAIKLHFSLGRWIIHNWGFYEGSRLSHYLRTTVGLSYPDDMARFIIIAYHRNLNRRSLDVKPLADGFIQMRDSIRQKELEQGTVIEEWTRKREGGGKEN